MTNVFSYLGIQDVHDLADRVLKGDAADLGSRAKMCTQTVQTVRSIAIELQQLSEQLFQSWTGVGADAAKAKMTSVIEARHRQAGPLTRSAGAFTACDNALVDAQHQAREIVAQADALGHALDTALRGVQLAMDAMTGGGLLNWGVKQLTGVDLEAEGRKLLEAELRPIYEQAFGLLARMEKVIREYEKVLLDQAAILQDMPGVVRTDAGPVDLPGDADLRRGALFTSVYGHPPETANDKLMAEALDMQGDDAANTDPNSHLVVTHITPVPGAGVVHGAPSSPATRWRIRNRMISTSSTRATTADSIRMPVPTNPGCPTTSTTNAASLSCGRMRPTATAEVRRPATRASAPNKTPRGGCACGLTALTLSRSSSGRT